MDKCRFSWVTKVNPHRVHCIHLSGHRGGGKHEDGEGSWVAVGMEMFATSPHWEPTEDYLEYSSSHSSNFGRDSQ